MAPRSIVSKLGVSVTLGAIFTIALLLVVVPIQQRRLLTENLLSELESIASALSISVQFAIEQENLGLLGQVNSFMSGNRDVTIAGIYLTEDGDSTLVAEFPPNVGLDRLTPEQLNDFLLVSLPFETSSASGRVLVGSARSILEESVRRVQIPIYLTFAGLAVVFALIFLSLSRGVVTPMMTSARIASRLGSGDLDIDIQIGTDNREVQVLSSSLVELRDNLSAAKAENEGLLKNLEHTVEERTSELNSALGELKESFQRLGAVLSSTNSLIWSFDRIRDEFHFTGATSDLSLFGLDSQANVALENILRRVHPDNRDVLIESFTAFLLNGADLEQHVQLETTPGQYRWFLLTGVPIPIGTDRSELALGSLVDMDERFRQEQRIWEMAHSDELTSTGNRTQFTQAFHEAVRREASGTLMLADINDFKLINDTKGHLTGDKVLIAFAEELKLRIPKAYSIARLGGDEFGIVVCPALGDSELALLFSQLQAGLAKRADLGLEVPVSISLGAASFPENGNDLEAVMQAADTAMYQAKREKLGGSAFSMFHLGMDAERLTRSALRSRIEAALQNDELELWYQPIWSSSQRGFLSAEALLRWPGDSTPIQTVIDIAEESELILRLGEFVIEKACEMLAALPSYAKDLRVSVNISPVQFHYQELVELIEKYSSAHQVNPSRLLIEITERTFIENSDLAQSVLKRLKAIGVQVAIDDFGTGYSSLNSLHQLDIDWIKIDRAFVTDINTDTQSYQIVNALVKMSEALDIGLVAEGVETQAESETLERLNVTRQQGYLFAKPMPFNKLLAFMLERTH